MLSPRQLRRVGWPFRWLGRATWAMLGFVTVAMTGAAFRDDVEWQITVPTVSIMVVAVGLMVGLGVYFTREGRRWRRVSDAEGPDRVVEAVLEEKGRSTVGSILHVTTDDGGYLLRTRNTWDMDTRTGDRITLQVYAVGPKLRGVYRNEHGGRPVPTSVKPWPA